MKKVIYSSLAILCLSLLATPVLAKGKPNKHKDSSSQNPTVLPQQVVQPQLGTQPNNESLQGGSRSNRGGKLRGHDRAREVQQLNNRSRGTRNSELQRDRNGIIPTQGLNQIPQPNN